MERESQKVGMFQIPEDPLHRRPVILRWTGHELADLIDREGEVQPGESEVLESADHMSVERGIGERSSFSG